MKRLLYGLLTFLALNPAFAQGPKGGGYPKNPTFETVKVGTTVVTPNLQTGTSYTLTSADCGKTVKLTNAAAITLTVPAGLPDGCRLILVQGGAGAVTPTASGTTLIQRESLTKTDGQSAVAWLIWTAADTYILGGELQ